MAIRELTTVEDFREALDRHQHIVITDTATGHRFHGAPWSCGHVKEENFITKVIEGSRRNGGYFTVDSFADAEARWPSVTRCA